MRLAITGTTGLLGRNLLFEILKQNINNLDNLEILVFSRPKNELSHAERIEEILLNDGLQYIGCSKDKLSDLLKSIIPIYFDLSKDNLAISNDGFYLLNKNPIDCFFHIAALTDFRHEKQVEEQLQKINVLGTKKITELISQLHVKQAAYVGSAYSCGKATGKVMPDYINLNEGFRNPYEKSKLEAEILFRNFAKDKKLKHKIFRPATICGRLIENPIGSINKFDVFYGWAAFFLRYKLKHIKSISNLYSESFNMPIRLAINKKSGLNIVPADFAGKIIYSVFARDEKDVSYHLANDKETPHSLYIDQILTGLNISGYSFVDKEPSDQSVIEKFHYKTVGQIFAPYTLSNSITFDVSNLKPLQRKIALECPPVNEENFSKLLKFAIKHNFGLQINTETK